MFKRNGEVIRTPFAPLEYECRKYNYLCSKLLHMKTRAILMGLVAVLCFASCKKERTCVPPASGDTPLTVVRGIELGTSLERCLQSPFVDSATWKKGVEYETYSDVWVQGIYENLHALYGFVFTDTSARKLQKVYIYPTYNCYDTAAVRILRDSLVALNTEKYGSPRLDHFGAGDDYGKYLYIWEVCDGVKITIAGSTGRLRPSDSILRDVTLIFNL